MVRGRSRDSRSPHRPPQRPPASIVIQTDKDTRAPGTPRQGRLLELPAPSAELNIAAPKQSDSGKTAQAGRDSPGRGGRDSRIPWLRHHRQDREEARKVILKPQDRTKYQGKGKREGRSRSPKPRVVLTGRPPVTLQEAPGQGAPVSSESIKDLEEKVNADRKEMETKKAAGKRMAPFIQDRMEKRAAKLEQLKRR